MIGNFVATAGPSARSCATPACGSRKNASLVKSNSKCRAIAPFHTAASPPDQDGARQRSRKARTFDRPRRNFVGIDDPRLRRSHRRRPMGMERLDCLQPPGLALLALLLGPDDRLPIGRED